MDAQRVLTNQTKGHYVACHPLCAQETPSPCPCPAKPSYGGSGTGTRLVHPRLCSRLVRSSPTDKPGAQGRNKGLAFCFVTFVAYLRTLKTKLLSQFQANAEVLLSHQLFPEDGAVKGRSVSLPASCGHGHSGHSTLVHGLGTCGGGPRAWQCSEGSRPSGSQTSLVGSRARRLHLGNLRGRLPLPWAPLAPCESLTSDPRRLALHPAARCSGYLTSSGLQKVSVSTVSVQKTAGT